MGRPPRVTAALAARRRPYDEVVGPKGRYDVDRSAVRHGHEDGSVTLGGRRVAVKRPRARSADGGVEVPLATYAHFADRDAQAQPDADAQRQQPLLAAPTSSPSAS